MIKRARVLRDATSGSSLLMMEGQQYRFSLAGEWKSDVPPKPGLVVDVELDAHGEVLGITVVPDSQLAKEQTKAAIAQARQKGQNPAASLVTRIGVPSLTAAGLLAASWFFLTAASVQVPFPGRLEFTFWQILGFLNTANVPELLDGSRSPNSGLYGLAAVVALLGPFIHLFWKNKSALLGGLLPLVFMIVIGIGVRNNIHSALEGSSNGPFADVAKDHGNAVRTVSLGLGAYLSIITSLYFALASAKGLVAKVSQGQAPAPAQRKAA
jgi:hypothetical protein